MNNTLTVKIDNAGGFEVRDTDVVRLTPKFARALIEIHAGQTSGDVTLSSVNPQNGEVWYTVYRVTAKSCRRTYHDFG